VLKLDYEKAYDRINWDFLDSMLASRGFGPIIRGWIRSFLFGGSFCVRVNDFNSPYFVVGKGLKQVTLSPLFFSILWLISSPKCSFELPKVN
jgi:hypothetical protein